MYPPCRAITPQPHSSLSHVRRKTHPPHNPMALIPCPDCGREVSTEARTCPHCGRPIATSVPPVPPPPTPSTKKGTPALSVILIVIGILLLLGGGLSILDHITTGLVPPPYGQEEWASARATKLLLSVIALIGGAVFIGFATFAKTLINK
jgi:hypothetical protein